MSSSGGRRLPWASSSAPSVKGTGTQKTQSPYEIGSSQNPIPLTTPSPTGSDAEQTPTSIASPSSKRKKPIGKAPIAVPPPPVGLHPTGLQASDFASPHFGLGGIENDNATALEIVDLTQSDEGQGMPFMGSTLVRVVGVRHYDGNAALGDQVLLERDHRNPYDKNAIQVSSSAQRQIGHIPRQMAAKLAPLIDNRQIHLEGVVTGKKGIYELPIRLDVYATCEDEASKARITEELRSGGMPFTIESTLQRGSIQR